MPNSQRKYDLVICDVDGCLISEAPGSLDPERLARVADYNRMAVRQEDRPLVTLCTGRPYPFTEAMVRLLQNTTVPCIAENGVWLYHAGTNEYVMDPAITQDDLDAVRTAESWIRRTYGPPGYAIQPGKTASVTVYHPDRDRMLALVPELEKACRDHDWPLRVSTTVLHINCDLAKVNKATGIRRLLETVKIPKERLAGIGDTHGDRFIADAVAFFACPANADDEIMSRARYVSPEPEIAGVIDILERLRG